MKFPASSTWLSTLTIVYYIAVSQTVLGRSFPTITGLEHLTSVNKFFPASNLLIVRLANHKFSKEIDDTKTDFKLLVYPTKECQGWSNIDIKGFQKLKHAKFLSISIEEIFSILSKLTTNIVQQAHFNTLIFEGREICETDCSVHLNNSNNNNNPPDLQYLEHLQIFNIPNNCVQLWKHLSSLSSHCIANNSCYPNLKHIEVSDAFFMTDSSQWIEKLITMSSGLEKLTLRNIVLCVKCEFLTRYWDDSIYSPKTIDITFKHETQNFQHFKTVASILRFSHILHFSSNFPFTRDRWKNVTVGKNMTSIQSLNIVWMKSTNETELSLASFQNFPNLQEIKITLEGNFTGSSSLGFNIWNIEALPKTVKRLQIVGKDFIVGDILHKCNYYYKKKKLSTGITIFVCSRQTA